MFSSPEYAWCDVRIFISIVVGIHLKHLYEMVPMSTLMFHVSCLLVEAHEMPSFFSKEKKQLLQNLLSAAVVIGSLRINPYKPSVHFVGHRHTV